MSKRTTCLQQPFVQSFDSYYVSEVDTLFSDPLGQHWTLSPERPTGPNISTLALYSTSYVSRNPRIIQDYRDKSVVDGLANLGGLWSFVCGVFSTVFGCSVIRVLFGARICSQRNKSEIQLNIGAKQLSVHGLVHKTGMKTIRKECLAQYPRLQDDLAALPSEKGLLSLIGDHLVDLDFLSEETEEVSGRFDGSELK